MAAYHCASMNQNQYITPEHILLAFMERILEDRIEYEMGTGYITVISILNSFIESLEKIDNTTTPIPSATLNKAFEYAEAQINTDNNEIDINDILSGISIINSSLASFLLNSPIIDSGKRLLDVVCPKL